MKISENLSVKGATFPPKSDKTVKRSPVLFADIRIRLKRRNAHYMERNAKPFQVKM